MQRSDWQNRAVLMLLAASLAAIVGCPPRSIEHPVGPVAPEEPMQDVIARVNQNVRAMNFLLRAGAVSATGKVVRSSGRTESFDANGTLFFRRPQNLYMQLTHSLAGKIEIGSNDLEFWYWERFDHPRYFTGRHADLTKPWETDVPLRPDQFLDMLAFHELLTATTGAAAPKFRVGKDEYYLKFFDRDNDGRTYESKELAISRRVPFLVSGVTYYNPSHRAWLRAEIGNYRQIEGTHVLAPSCIQIQSLKDASKMTLTFGNLRPSDNKEIEKRIARSPLQRGEDVGEIIHLDRRPVFPAGRPSGTREH